MGGGFNHPPLGWRWGRITPSPCYFPAKVKEPGAPIAFVRQVLYAFRPDSYALIYQIRAIAILHLPDPALRMAVAIWWSCVIGCVSSCVVFAAHICVHLTGKGSAMSLSSLGVAALLSALCSHLIFHFCNLSPAKFLGSKFCRCHISRPLSDTQITPKVTPIWVKFSRRKNYNCPSPKGICTLRKEGSG